MSITKYNCTLLNIVQAFRSALSAYWQWIGCFYCRWVGLVAFIRFQFCSAPSKIQL